LDLEAQWFPSLVEDCLIMLDSTSLDHEGDASVRGPYLERLCELFIDLLSQLPTRRFVHSLLDDYQLIIRFQRSASFLNEGNTALRQLVSQFHAILSFGIENQTGKSLAPHEMVGLKNQELQRLQQIAYLNFKEQCSDIIYSSTGELGKENNFRKLFSLIPLDCLIGLAKKLGYVSCTSRPTDVPLTTEYLLDVFVEKLCFKHSLSFASTKQLMLYPTGQPQRLSLPTHQTHHSLEQNIWDDRLAPLNRKYSGNEVCVAPKTCLTFLKALPLPKMNLQFLTLGDYLMRNFTLYQIESTTQIR
jgi:intron-binding protein aquarius